MTISKINDDVTYNDVTFFILLHDSEGKQFDIILDSLIIIPAHTANKQLIN